jgi:hypothetical protein
MNGGWSHGMATSRCAVTAIAYRANYAEPWLKCVSDSTADWQFMIAKANWPHGIGCNQQPPAGRWCRILWEQALIVERRELAVYEEVAQWS